MKASTDFLLSRRSIPALIIRLAFLSVNLGAQEVIGMVASEMKQASSRAAPPFNNSRAFNSETSLHPGEDITYAG